MTAGKATSERPEAWGSLNHSPCWARTGNRERGKLFFKLCSPVLDFTRAIQSCNKVLAPPGWVIRQEFLKFTFPTLYVLPQPELMMKNRNHKVRFLVITLVF